MTDHTPSPWHWIQDNWWGGYAALVDAEDNTVLAPDHCNDGDDGAAWFEEYPTEADRLLMQASPDIHEALEDIVDYYKNTYHHSNHVLIKGQAALKLAKEGRNAHEPT